MIPSAAATAVCDVVVLEAAIRAWPDRQDAGTKWRKIRNGTDLRGVQVYDAYDLAMAIRVSFVEVCGLAKAKMLSMSQTARMRSRVNGTLRFSECKT